MKKTLITSLLVACMTFASCNRTGPSTAGSPSPARSEAQAQVPSDVLILFSGLMVFHEKAEDKYEVGILQHKADHGFSADHRFSVSVDGTDILDEDLPNVESSWTLDTIPSPTPTPPVGEAYIEKENRRPDDEDHKSDFGWIIDLEKFHSDLGDLKSGYLKPIIELPYGALSTKYKSYDLVRWQGGKPEDGPNESAENFGFVPETIALPLKLGPEDKLILRGGGKELELISKPSHAFHMVVIKNVPTKYSENSDFHLYYKLFKDKEGKDIPADKQYHFQANRIDPWPALNPFPGHKKNIKDLPNDKKRTCCMMACTAIRTQQVLR